jgi:hypothetical protein
MLVPAFMKARDSRAQAAQAQMAAKQAALAAREVKVSGTVTDFNTGDRLFLNPEKYSPVSPQPGQLDWGFKAFVPPHSLATFLFVVWSNGVPAVDQGFSTYFKVGPAGGIDIAFCSVSCYPEATSREFSNLSEPQRTQFLTGWSYPRGADASNAMHWNVNLGANSTAGAIRAMPLPRYHLVEAALPQNVSSGCQLRFPLIEFEHPANSPSNGWSGVDLRIFLEHLNVPPVRQLPNEIDMTKYIAGWGVRGTLEETIKKIRDTPLSGAASATTNSRAGAQTGELEQLLAQLREARTKYTDQNPLVVSLLERIERLREQNR